MGFWGALGSHGSSPNAANELYEVWEFGEEEKGPWQGGSIAKRRPIVSRCDGRGEEILQV